MPEPRTSVLVLCLLCAVAAAVSLASAPQDRPAGEGGAAQEPGPAALVAAMIGRWQGTCRTWFRPGELADESKVAGTVEPLLGGHLVRHTYEGSMKGKPRRGEETIAYNALEASFQVSWFDDFHMNYGLLLSVGERTERGFSVSGHYRMAPDQKAWGWRTEYAMADDDHLTITAYNVTPDGEEYEAVETVYERVE